MSIEDDLLKPCTEPAIDIELLKLNLGALEDELAECIGFLSETFLEDVPEMLTALQQSIQQADADQVRFHVHTLKSSSATLGATHLSALCLALENQSKVGDLSQAQAIADAIQSEFERVKTAMEHLQASFNA